MRAQREAWFQSVGSLHESSRESLVSVSREPSWELRDIGGSDSLLHLLAPSHLSPPCPLEAPPENHLCAPVAPIKQPVALS